LATEKIRIQYEVDKKQLDASNESLKKTAKANDVVQKEVDETTNKFKKQDKQLAKTNSAFAGLGGQLTALGNRFQIAGKGMGDMASGMLSATRATGGATKAMKLLKVAIASTGIGLLVIALGSLSAAFKSSEGGQNKFIKIMGAIGVVIGNVSDVFASFGEQVISFFSGDGFDATKITEAFDDLINKTGEEIALQQKLADKTAATNILEREFLVRTAELESKVADLRLKGRQEDEFTANQRLAFLNEANDLQNELIETELTIARNRAEEQTISNSFSKSTRENLDAEAQLKAKVFQVEAKRLNQQRTLQREINTTTKQAQALSDKEAKQAQDVLKKEDEKRLAQAQIDAETLAQKKQAESDLTVFRLEQAGKLEEAEMERRKRLLENEELIEEERALIIEESEAVITEIHQKAAADVADRKIATDEEVNKSVIDGRRATFDAVSGLVNKESAAGKAAAIAQVGIQTQLAAASALAPPPIGAGPLFGPILAATTIAQGLISASRIAGITPKFEKGGKIGGNLHSGGRSEERRVGKEGR